VRRFEVDTVVHNAGVIRPALLADVDLSDLDALTELHLGCAIQLVQAALPRMREQHFGRVVLMSSRAAVGLSTRTAYSATKAGMLGMARTWALELAADGITVNVVAPGPIRTDMFYDVVEEGSDKERALAASVPVKRLGESADVARAVSFFVDPANGFVTGQVLYVCGGTSVGSLAL
ncbi:MAG: SDR family oxidoreductase, partial [Variovorax sp.]|nr:SDR family oxidoreductase [Variovorax sp.]